MARFINLKSAAVILIAGIGVIAVYPEAIRYLPYLLLLACPLSMMFMHGGHGSHSEHRQSPAQLMQLREYVCPMHDEVRSTFPGECPVCGMELEPAPTRALRR
jgi:hypothetical protein